MDIEEIKKRNEEAKVMREKLARATGIHDAIHPTAIDDIDKLIEVIERARGALSEMRAIQEKYETTPVYDYPSVNALADMTTIIDTYYGDKK